MTPFSDEEMLRLRRLIDEDDIRKLALLYSHLQDHAYIERMREIFTDDIVCEFGPYGRWEGIDTVIRNFHANKEHLGGKPFMAMHSNTFHWIEFRDADTALGRRQLLDFLLTTEPDKNPILWLGLYEDRYRRTDAGWRINHIRLEFFWPERHVSDGFPGEFPPHR